jgi:hypothetical protein
MELPHRIKAGRGYALITDGLPTERREKVTVLIKNTARSLLRSLRKHCGQAATQRLLTGHAEVISRVPISGLPTIHSEPCLSLPTSPFVDRECCDLVANP